MTDDDLKTRTNDFVHALAASDADVANITAEKSEQGMRVTLDLLDPDDTNLVCEVGGVIEDFPHLHRYRSLQTTKSAPRLGAKPSLFISQEPCICS
jgi:hypothetical protein